MPRQLTNWTDAFNQYTKERGSPALFRRWAGIFTVAAALERRVWIKTNKGVLYPNMYIVSVGPPGAGKTLATSIGHDFLTSIDDLHVAPTSVTKASLIDALALAERKIVRPMDNPPVITFNSLIVTSDELGVFLPNYENDFMNVLTNIYDCRIYSETRRTNKISIEMKAPQLNIAAATTPSYLNALLPEGAWDQGFLSRTILVYSGAEPPGDLFSETEMDLMLEAALKKDLAQIFRLYGPMKFTEEASAAINEWHKAGGPPAPDHPKLHHYNTRRTAHLLKLCMVASVSSGDEMVITLEHFAEALDWLIEVEAAMPDIFKSMKSGGDGRIIEECYHFVYGIFMREGKKPVASTRVFHFLQERTPAHNVERIVSVMEQAGLFTKKLTETGHGYEPRGRSAT